ncbi:MAG: amidohydrolase family protein [Nitrosopumilaceae archaeon]|nr:amidohydrolase family protein [Nitrosopumilaceae archaeon]
MLIKNVSILHGNELNFIKKTNVRIIDGKFEKIHPSLQLLTNEKSIDGEGFLLIPGLINCHTHIGDSIAKDITLNSSVNAKIHPVFGVKSKILKKTNENHLSTFMKISCESMLRKGITTFVDFREGGLDGIQLVKSAIKKLPIRSVLLGRINYYQTSTEIKKNKPMESEKKTELTNLLENCDGIGISGANENSSMTLKYYSLTRKLRAIHSSEMPESVLKSKKITGQSETKRALLMKPHFLVHMTHASKADLRKAAKHTRGIVICPRANAALAEGIPDIELMKQQGCNLALGTDNIMINSPDLFREMDFLWKFTMGIHKKRLDPKEILKMATVNAEKILKKNIGIIAIGKMADCLFIDKHSLDLEPMHDPYASLIHRASETAIKAVMINGKIVHGKI